MNEIKKIADIFQSVSVIAGAWLVYLYYKGRLNYKGIEEKVRQEHVEKRGGFILALCVLMFFFGILLFIISLLRLFAVITN